MIFCNNISELTLSGHWLGFLRVYKPLTMGLLNVGGCGAHNLWELITMKTSAGLYYKFLFSTITIWSVHYFLILIMWLYHVMSPCNILTCDCDVWHLSCDTFHTPSCIVSPKEKENKKRNINNDLAILPSHNTLLAVIKPLYLEYSEEDSMNGQQNYLSYSSIISPSWPS